MSETQKSVGSASVMSQESHATPRAECDCAHSANRTDLPDPANPATRVTAWAVIESSRRPTRSGRGIYEAGSLGITNLVRGGTYLRSKRRSVVVHLGSGD